MLRFVTPLGFELSCIERLKVRPGSFLGHLLLWYHNEVKVSIPSNRPLLGIETLIFVSKIAPNIYVSKYTFSALTCIIT